ncbi:MAG: hypothetical protein NZ750_09215 [Anaerolineae bacterium]|nr:hypothetical protein [Anaerolineae bacterium]MDW8171798.1 hypothetical protein [Anaerolineae bacterium]
MVEFTTPDTTAYLWLGLGVSLGALLLYILALLGRWRSLQKDAETLRQLQED